MLWPKKQYKNKGNENNHFELNYYYYRFISDTPYKQEPRSIGENIMAFIRETKQNKKRSTNTCQSMTAALRLESA